MVGPLISSLGFIAAPMAVFFTIALVIVYPVYGRFRKRFFSHVEKELLERIPLFAHRYPPAAIVLKRRLAGIGASSKHTRPGTIFRSIYPIVLSLHTLKQFAFGASATGGEIGGSKPFSGSYNHIPAVTDTLPQSFAVLVGADTLYNNKASESFSHFI